MTPTALILIVFSTFAHTGWNFIGKQKNPAPAFMLLANTLGTLCLIPILFKYGYLTAEFTPTIWFWLFVTGLFQAIYYTGVAEAYRHGDMSIAYPLVRSGGAVLVLLVNLVLGKAGQISALCIIGIVLVATGGMILPVKNIREWNLKKFLQLSSVFAMVGAIGMCGYSIVDSHALSILKSTIDAGVQKGPWWTLLYGFYEGLTSSIWLAIYVLFNRGERENLKESVKTQFVPGLLTGMGIYIAYCLVLAAYLYARNVSYVVAFRQLGIPLSAALGILFLHEPRYFNKYLGLVIMLTGLVLVALK